MRALRQRADIALREGHRLRDQVAVGLRYGRAGPRAGGDRRPDHARRRGQRGEAHRRTGRVGVGADHANADIAVEMAEEPVILAETRQGIGRLGLLGLVVDAAADIVRRRRRERIIVAQGHPAPAAGFSVLQIVIGVLDAVADQPLAREPPAAARLDATAEEVGVAVILRLAGQARILVGRVIAGRVEINRRAGRTPILFGQQGPIVAGLARGRVAIGAAHTQSERLQEAVVVEAIFGVRAIGPFVRVIVLDMVHRRRPVIVALLLPRARTGRTAGRRDQHLGRIAVEHEIDGRQRRRLVVGGHADHRRARLHILQVGAERPMLGRRPLEVAGEILRLVGLVAVARIGVELAILDRARDDLVLRAEFVGRIVGVGRIIVAHRIFEIVRRRLRDERLGGDQQSVARLPLDRAVERAAALLPVDPAETHARGQIDG